MNNKQLKTFNEEQIKIITDEQIRQIPIYSFNERTKKKVINYIYNYTKSEFGEYLDTDHNCIRARVLVTSISEVYKPIELEHLLSQLKIENLKFTDSNVGMFIALYISWGSMIISLINGFSKPNSPNIWDILLVMLVVFVGIVITLKVIVFSPRGKKLNTAIFYIEQALKQTQT